MKEAKAFSPGHITGLFQICDQQKDPLQIGSRGAGVSITRGAATKVQVENSAKTSVKIMIDGEVTDSALVSEYVANAFLSRIGEGGKVLVEHDVELPIGCGFGSSGAGAISLAFALNKAFNNRLSRLEATQLAHVAEVECGTGLGTVVAEASGGLEIRVRSGAPGVGEIKTVPTNEDYAVACLSFGPLSTSRILKDESFRQRINKLGGDFVDELARHPTPLNLMNFSRKFAEHTGLITKRVRAVLEETDTADITCSMAMLGETTFSIVKKDQIEEIHRIFSKHAPSEESVIITEIDYKGARLL